MNNIINKIKEFDSNKGSLLVCFDYFDTIASRKYSPEEVKRTWAKKCCDFLFSDLAWEHLYSVRLSCERELYGPNYINEFTYEKLMQCVYLSINAQNTISFSEFLNFSKSLETKIELEVQELNEDILDAVKFCKDNGFFIAIISDFYLGKDVFLEFLTNKGILDYFDEIFISCDYLKSKKNKELYFVVKDNYPNFNFIMIGDNYNSDFLNSVDCDFNAVIYHSNNAKHSNYDKFPKRFVSKSLRKEFSKKSFLSNYAFPLFIFTEKLYKYLFDNNINDVFFLSRDGEFLKIIFDIYQESMPVNFRVNSHYLLVSRSATYLASCKELENETFEKLFRQYNNISILDFLKSLSFSETQINEIISTLEYNDDSIIENFCDSNKDTPFRSLLNNDIFKNYYEYNRINSKEALNTYLKDVFKNNSEIYLVDVGWKGSIQDNIFNSLDNEVSFIGLYYGLIKNDTEFEKNSKIGLMFGPDSHNVFCFDYWFIENILTGSHKKVSGYFFQNNKYTINFEEDSDSILYELYIKKLRVEIIDKYCRIFNLLNYTRFSSDEFISLFFRFHFILTRFYPILCFKQNYIIRTLHSEGFGEYSNVKEVSAFKSYKYFLKEYGISYVIKQIFCLFKSFFNSNLNF